MRPETVMPERSFHWPEGHWDWLIHLSHQHGVRSGELIFVGGQVDKDMAGLRLNPYDLAAQTATAVRHIGTVLAGFDANLTDVVRLVAFYVNDGSVDEQAFLADIGRHMVGHGVEQGPAITLVPLPWLAYPEMLVEIEAVAMLGEDGRHLPRTAANPPELMALPAPFNHGLRCGEHLWVGGQTPHDADGKLCHSGDMVAQTTVVMDNMGLVLAAMGADVNDAIKFNIWFRGDGTVHSWTDAAIARGAYFNDPGPPATGLPTPNLPAGEMTRVEVWAMRAEDGSYIPRQYAWPDGTWDWPIPLPYQMGVKCRDVVVVGGQVPLDEKGAVMDPGELLDQTRRTMEFIRRVLAEFDLTMDHMVKQNAFYKGETGPDVIVANQALRSSYYNEPAGASTGIPLAFLTQAELMIEVEIIAMM
jgi:enamine deaminase RidA (YjgF/YER057c/UK114 family)